MNFANAQALESAVGPYARREIEDAIDMLAPFGNKYYVCNRTGANGSNSNPGTTRQAPLATIAAAIALCSASQGDTIIVLPGHAESFATDLDIATAGINIIGVGVGENRPILTFTATGAKIDLDAANVKIRNFVLKNDVDEQVAVIDVDGAGAILEDIEILEGSSKQFLIGIDLGADRPTVRRCYIKSVAAGANSGIKISAAIDRAAIKECEVFGDFADAAIHNPTSAVATRLNISDNVLTNLQSGDHAIELVSACTGVINRNIVNSTLAAAGTAGAIDQGSCFANLNYGVDATADVQGILNPVADS